MKENVIRGAKLLDNVKPEWYNQIDLEALNILDGCNCILGQLYGSYVGGYVKTNLTGPNDRVRHGFIRANESDWVQEILERQIRERESIKEEELVSA